MKIVMAADHGGFLYKKILQDVFTRKGFEITDLGAYNEAPSDYPDFAALVAKAVSDGTAQRGVLICGSGAGVSVAANKFKGIRAALCHDTYTAHQCVEHDDVNVLCMGQRVIGIELATEVLSAFLNAVFSKEERHINRLSKVIQFENTNMK